MVTADQHQDNARTRRCYRGRGRGRGRGRRRSGHRRCRGRCGNRIHREHHRFHSLRERDPQQLSDRLALRAPRRGRPGKGLRRHRAGRQQGQRFGQFDVGCVFRGVRHSDCVLAGIGQHLKLVRCATPDRSGIRSDGTKPQAHSIEDPLVRIKHDLVARERTSRIPVERVGVLHRELTPPHDPKTGPTFVAELGLDMPEIFRQLAPGTKLGPRNVGHHLLRCRLNHKITPMPVLDPHQLWPVFFPAPRLHPDLGRLYDRHEQLEGTGTFHLIAHDRFNPANDAQTQGQVGVNPASEPADHAGPCHQSVAGNLGIGWGLFKRSKVESRSFHRFDRPWL